MKPVELSLTGFRSYPNPVTVDFTGKSLAAVLGDTGAGKSSLLEAISFALFRKSSWGGNETRQLIADTADAMSVTLTFQHDGSRWRVDRTMHATNPNAGRHHLVNLDTGQEYDGAGPVDARIKAVLQMGYDTFLRVGLLPQGKFDQLLTAPPRERTTRLRELFGADALNTVQQSAARRCLSLTDLLKGAEIKRAAMPGNPAQAAAAADAAAQTAEADARRLDDALTGMTALQKQATGAATAANTVDRAARALADQAVPDAESVLDGLEPVIAGIAARRESLDLRAYEAAKRNRELTEKIDDLDARGEGRDALIKAAAIMENLAARAEEHRAERDRLAAVDEQLARDAESIATTERQLAKRAEQAEPLAEAARTATTLSRQIRIQGDRARSRVSAATLAAQQVAIAARAATTARGNVEAALAALTASKNENTGAEEAVTAAEHHLEAVQLRNQAASIASDVHPGDDCPVCRRQLPADFEPEAASEAALDTAKTQLRNAKAKQKTAARKLADAESALAADETAVSTSGTEHEKSQRAAQRATEEAAQILADFASLAAEAGNAFDSGVARATLTGATAALTTHPDTSAPTPESLTEPVITALAAAEEAAADRAEQLRESAIRHTAAIDADRVALNKQKTVHHNAVNDAQAASTRQKRAASRMAREMRALPDRIQTLLPGDAVDVTAADADAAHKTIAALQTAVQRLLDERDETKTDAAAVLAEQRALDTEARTAADEPLNTLRTRLNACANAANQAVTHLPGTSRDRVPVAVAETDVTELRVFAKTLATAVAAMGSELAETHAAHLAQAHDAETRLRELAAELADVDGFAPADDLTDPQLLHPLVAALATATKEAEVQRAAQNAAQHHIKPAADLDFAISAGQARLNALSVLRTELVDAKFLRHLTALNTRTLLGIASNNLGLLTDQRFGFSDGFEIVSRGSGVAHTPNRLSGGEKFLASLALALALAELHSHSGPRLGSLFLDEGFAALDTTALQSALEVLRTQAGGDRLVVVISHLHAVAEAVDDVLWVERGPAGSLARWMTPPERDRLVQADVASGLQTLA
ncbi:AAA family ATPase [Amycolatopsis benzoatilytica]|uniref:AAA family ATPase n=1 Tax=Amycolatopsis benzoatilytica TaxID=346045 RepID=UPI00037BCC82|nr:SMC family ATPase [Amycolatopsis benzoatilytica]